MLGPVGLGQDDLPAHDRRLRAAGQRARSSSAARTSRACRRDERDVNTVFQDYALFPHMSVGQNVEYGLKVKKRPAAERRERVERGARAGPARGLREAPPEPALGRPAPARRARTGARQQAARAAAGRAARRARPEAAPAAPGGAEAHPAGGRDHVHLRHARPGRGALDERPDRGHGQRPRHPGRLAAGRLRRAAIASSWPASSASRTCSSWRSSRSRTASPTLRLGPAGQGASRESTDAVSAGQKAIVTIRPERIALAEGSRRRARRDGDCRASRNRQGKPLRRADDAVRRRARRRR